MCGENKLCCVCSEKKMSDSYPEYLNPFAEDLKPKPKLTIRNSFKELKRNLRQSFRIKKKDEGEGEVMLRRKTETLQRLPVSYPSPSQSTFQALPRSRFHERVSRSDYNTNNLGINPFEEEDNDDTRSTIIRRRAKKRAPLPPPNKSMSSQHINDDKLEVSAGGSHWSLTSVETDYSGSVYNSVTREESKPEEKRESMVEKFVDFNKNMESFKDDTNNNVITKENQEIESNNNIPDLVVSCPSESDKLINNNSDERNETDDEEKKSVVSEDDSTELVIKDITNNMIIDENTNNTHEENVHVINDKAQTDDEDPYLYHEKKSLYIAGSRDELNDSDAYTGRVSLYITGSCDDLDASNNNKVCNKNEINENSNDDVVPIPKQRKNKLTRNVLLGM